MRYREAVKMCKKTVFSKKKKTNTEMNAIKHATQPKIQSTFKLSKTSLNNKNCSAYRFQKHTHTHTHKISLTNFTF